MVAKPTIGLTIRQSELYQTLSTYSAETGTDRQATQRLSRRDAQRPYVERAQPPDAVDVRRAHSRPTSTSDAPADPFVQEATGLRNVLKAPLWGLAGGSRSLLRLLSVFVGMIVWRRYACQAPAVTRRNWTLDTTIEEKQNDVYEVRAAADLSHHALGHRAALSHSCVGHAGACHSGGGTRVHART